MTRDEAFKIVTNNLMDIQYIDDIYKNDKGIVMQSVKFYGGALQHTSKRLQANEIFNIIILTFLLRIYYNIKILLLKNIY